MLKASGKRRLGGLAESIKLFALVSEALKLLVTVAQFFQEAFYGLLAHPKSDSFPEFKPILLFGVGSYDCFKVVARELEYVSFHKLAAARDRPHLGCPIQIQFTCNFLHYSINIRNGVLVCLK
jgi:hypothetical protein